LSKLNAALDLAAKGFRVFPLVPNGKTPAIKQWPDLATCDVETIERWWSQDPTCNIGIATGNGLVVLDFDVKNNGQGLNDLAKFEEQGLDSSVEVATASGGSHVYLQVPSGIEIANSAKKIAPATDVRGHHGYVVAPGSQVDGRHYDWVNSRDSVQLDTLPTCPSFILDQCAKPRPKSEAPAPEIPLDGAAAIARASSYLASVEPAISSQGGNDHTYRVAARVKDFGVSEGVALDLLLEHWNERCEPPWSVNELETIVSHAYQYGTAPPGKSSAEMEFEPYEMGTAPETPNRFNWLTNTNCTKPFINANWLVKKVLPANGLGVLYGRPGSGKSAISLDLAMHIALGLPWQGRASKQCGVTYISSEGSHPGNRVFAWLSANGIADWPPGLRISPATLNLRSTSKDASALIDDIATNQPTCGLIVIDTLARNMAGGNENASEDMGAFITNCDRLAKATGALVLVIHHSGKDASKGARGFSGLLGAVDFEGEVERPFEPADGPGTITITKLRDGQDGLKFGFKLVQQVLGLDQDGDAQSSVAAMPAPVSRVKAEIAADAKETVAAIVEQMGLRPGVWHPWQPVADQLREAMSWDYVPYRDWFKQYESDRKYRFGSTLDIIFKKRSGAKGSVFTLTKIEIEHSEHLDANDAQDIEKSEYFN
jgi:hypothetical protein